MQSPAQRPFCGQLGAPGLVPRTGKVYGTLSQNVMEAIMADTKSCGCGEHLMGLPEIDFSTFVLSLSSSAMVHLGEAPDPSTGQTDYQPHLAKQVIDILGMLQLKTEKGLDDEERKLLCEMLYALRMKYVGKAG